MLNCQLPLITISCWTKSGSFWLKSDLVLCSAASNADLNAAPWLSSNNNRRRPEGGERRDVLGLPSPSRRLLVYLDLELVVGRRAITLPTERRRLDGAAIVVLVVRIQAWRSWAVVDS